MITDAQTRLSNAQAITTGTQVSTNTWDGLATATNPGVGENRRVFAKVSTTLTGGTSVQCQLIQSANANLSSPDVLISGPVVAEAAAVAGAVLLDTIIPPTVTKRYIGVQYVNVGTHGAGAVEAHIVADVSHMTYPPSNTGY